MKKDNYKYLQHVLKLCINLVYSMAMLVAIAIMVVSCSDELDRGGSDVPTEFVFKTGTLSASTSEVVIDNAKFGDVAVTISWNADKYIYSQYKLVLTSGTKSETVDVLADVSKKFTNSELNNILLDKLALEIDQVANIDIVVHGKFEKKGKEVQTASSNTITLTVVPAIKIIETPAYTKLWIVGDATPNGWDIGNPNEMINDKSSIYQFKYNEVLKSGGEGAFKIPVATGNWGAAFYRPNIADGFQSDLSNTEVRFAPGGSPGDAKWKITNPGPYKILLNISSSPFIKFTPFTPFSNIYILGDATTAGWGENNPIAMTVSGDPNIFTWTGPLTAGQFRFPLSVGNLNGKFFVAPSFNASITTATQVTFAPNGTPAKNFKVKAGEEGTYKITINQFKETISIVKQ